MTVRAKFRCSTMETGTSAPQEVLTNQRQEDGTYKLVPTGEKSWPRTYRFSAVYDDGQPENQRYAKYTPSGELRIQVDNPAVEFECGKDYYLDFTPVETAQE